MLLFTGGLLATFGSTYIDMAGAGPLGCLVLPFVSGIRWRKMNTPEQTVCILACLILVQTASFDIEMYMYIIPL